MTDGQFSVWRSLALAVAKFVRDDQAATYPLPEPVSVTISSERVAALPRGETTETADKSLRIVRLGGNRISIHAQAFTRESRLWNGPDVLPNTRLRSMLASLFHDLIWGHREELAQAWDCSEKTVLEWGNDVLFLVWRWASKDSWWGRREAWLAFQATQLAAPWYHKVKKAATMLLAACAGALCLAGCAGCYSLPDGDVEDVSGVDVVRGVMEKWGDGLSYPTETCDADK